MKRLWTCRRTFIALSCIIVLGVLGYTKDMDVAMALSGIAMGMAGANAYEKKK